MKTIGISASCASIARICSREDRAHLMSEARLLRSLRHENVGEIYGVALHYSPIILVLEYFSMSLFTYLQRNPGRVSARDRRRFVCEAAAGLSYLAQSNCIHRDIAARNCKLNNSLQVKISGFTLCAHLGEKRDSPTMQIAVKWQAPEVLNDRKYTLKSDVWSFGILMWEVYTDAAEPYPGMSPSVVKQVDCPQLLAKIMASCWDSYPPKRPCMQAIHLVIRDR
ncbi:protein tyrosine kinase [Ostertagia ostertagi]